jgi:superfamily II DNA/RNA helicase
MLDMGFIRDMKKIMQQVPTQRQTLLFSATLSGEVHQIAQNFMKHPHVVKAEAYIDKGKLEQIYYDLDKRGDQKFGLLMHILKEEKPPLAIIFAGTRRMVDKVERNLNQHNVHAQSIHGGLSQNQRKRTLDDFHRGHFHVLVASDVAARGLDIKNVSHIINYDIPRTASEYIHRSGRTARAGEEGKIISLLAPQDYEYFRSVLRDKSIPITETPIPVFEPIEFANKKGKPEYSSSQGQGSSHARPTQGKPYHAQRGGSGEGYSPQGGKRFFPRKSEIEGKPYGNKRFGDSKPFGSRPTSGGTSFAQSGTRSRDERPTRDPNWKGKKPFIKGKRYPQDENIKVTKHFGLKHAPKDD